MSTFLEIQNNLLTEFPGMPRPIIKACIADAYQELYRKWQWSAFERVFQLPLLGAIETATDETETLEADYDTNTIAVANGSTTVTGSHHSGDETGWVGSSTNTALVGAYFKVTVSDDHRATVPTALTEADIAIYKVTASTLYSGTGPTAATLTLDKAWIGAAQTFQTSTYNGAHYRVWKTIYPLIAQPTTEIVDEILELFSDDQILQELPRSELIRRDPERTEINKPTHWAKAGKDSSGNRLIEVWPIPDDDYVIYARCRILPTTTITDSASPLLDGQLVEAFAWLKIAPKAMRLLGDKTLAEMMPYKKEYATELYNDMMMDDTRASSQYQRIRNVTDGLSYFDSNEFQIDHDVN